MPNVPMENYDPEINQFENQLRNNLGYKSGQIR
jgi:hypothetical protein